MFVCMYVCERQRQRGERFIWFPVQHNIIHVMNWTRTLQDPGSDSRLKELALLFLPGAWLCHHYIFVVEFVKSHDNDLAVRSNPRHHKYVVLASGWWRVIRSARAIDTKWFIIVLQIYDIVGRFFKCVTVD